VNIKRTSWTLKVKTRDADSPAGVMFGPLNLQARKNMDVRARGTLNVSVSHCKKGLNTLTDIIYVTMTAVFQPVYFQRAQSRVQSKQKIYHT
jgi:hypothetical protein